MNMLSLSEGPPEHCTPYHFNDIFYPQRKLTVRELLRRRRRKLSSWRLLTQWPYFCWLNCWNHRHAMNQRCGLLSWPAISNGLMFELSWKSRLLIYSSHNWLPLMMHPLRLNSQLLVKSLPHCPFSLKTTTSILFRTHWSLKLKANPAVKITIKEVAIDGRVPFFCTFLNKILHWQHDF